ncbi:bifunctional proline dehydrogenase/L-glutamate gamma-semialdehyde dehydrogenase PutA [Curvibacter sp. CHRR-16]|uniref:bifunctional proline dehydrogenase/L-glutamate gamma-semialdehyde dehydrogenase PutA n=1 Tax=Curvibacter sp. CHRR-16 TaxID=2835872 RepID=UPI001BD9926D|nr:bifunctional proline dehydrogenase/L-glutamate gamma-semialdehyde dehydrogenase PutA [Curvibacter sp. CHRR-16]MBT0570586.1 bifunctional proline dehydrogenase/L-glutamate gamma-semialdehyde dehydrogenase PutA [Curvibacter sp. CHRR-16]
MTNPVADPVVHSLPSPLPSVLLPTPYEAESQAVAQRLQLLDGALAWDGAARMALPWVQAVRDNPPPFWAMESLLREYPISSVEGLALMRLAEALLRVPDAATALSLTADQLGRADFASATAAHDAPPALARLSNVALQWAKHCLPEPGNADQASLWRRMGGRTVVVAALRAVQLLGQQFVLGQTMPLAWQQAQRSRQQAQQQGSASLRYSYDMLGEGARTEADALRYLQHYEDAIGFIAAHTDGTVAPTDKDGISIKLSALYPRYEAAQHQQVMQVLVPRVWGLCGLAARANINLTLDAEEVDRLELSLQVLDALLARVAQQHPQWCGLGLALQAYQTRSLALVRQVITMARRYRVRLMCRLVKGAYWDAEVKRAQELGLPHYPVFTHKSHTDASYLACARVLLAAPDAVYPQFATHNAATIAALLQLAAQSSTVAQAEQLTGSPAQPLPSGHNPWPRRLELQRLHGMGEGVYREVLRDPLLVCRVYAPVGAHRDLLAYLVRRLLENGANSSFVHQLADTAVPPERLLASPLQLQPDAKLPLPDSLYGPVHEPAQSSAGSTRARRNSAGLDLTQPGDVQPLLDAYAQCRLEDYPFDSEELAASAYAASWKCYQKWSKTPVHQRADALLFAADALQAELPQWCALLVKEAHKTWGDAVAEVREAIDFLRYYAAQAVPLMQAQACPALEPAWQTQYGAQWFGLTGEHNTLTLRPRGVWVCISPWNFPLAIFMGQVAAALVTGNTVLAKPAEQTPRIARKAVQLLHASGVPEPAVQLLHGPGETVGAALVALPGVAGVVFTGSTQVAKTIQRTLAAKEGPIVPLIAETGGLNAMVVDSSALPEQVVDAVVQSAFRSAGQRCSALRVLCVHEAIADDVLPMLRGALQTLVLGDPAHLATDVGPLIDGQAYARACQQLQAYGVHILEEKMATELDGIAMKAIKTIANMLPPQLIEIDSLQQVREEIFAPVLLVLRWRGDPLAMIEQINALGYGLTLGIHTRIDSRAAAMAAAARVGNVYVNRNMIGAVVGVQPFGGEGLSGTGPKAGGPHYLLRFCTEQTVTINTTAAGGNAALLAG